MPGDGSIVKMHRIVKRFPGQTAVDQVTFDLRRGEIHALLGQNGAGKSTLIKILAGLYGKDEGDLVVDEQPVEVNSPAHARSLGIHAVHQELSLIPAFNAMENLMLGLPYPRRFGLIDWKAARLRARRVAELMNFTFPLNTPVSRLGIGDRWMVNIARAVVQDAKVLILDEPTVALTHTETERLFNILRRLKQSGVGIIYVSHRLGEVRHLCDRATIMKDGRKVGTVDVAEVDEDRLITMIAGRELRELYPEQRTEVSRGEPVLEVRDLRGNGVRNASFTLHAGEILGLAGLVGARRTELARMIFGADAKEAGEVRVSGRPVRLRAPADAMAAGIIMIPEDRWNQGLVLGMSIRANTTLAQLRPGRRWAGAGFLSAFRERQITRTLIRQLDIRPPFTECRVAALSGGNQQKVVLARWLHHGARVFLLDEPTSGVDVGAKADIYRQIRHLAAEGAAVLLISSDFHELLGLADRLLVMREGLLVTELAREQATEDRVLGICYGRG